MKLRFSESKIQQWAEAFSNTNDDSELQGLRMFVKNTGCLSKDQLRILARWKSPRSAPNIEFNSDEFVQEVTGFALSAKDERSRIESLTILDGVSWPTASVILHFFHSDFYPILDVRAIWSVGLNQPSQYTFEFWSQYLRFCRELALRNKVSMRVLDQALWQFSKDHQTADLT